MRKAWKVVVKNYPGTDTLSGGTIGTLIESLRYAGLLGDVERRFEDYTGKSFYDFSVYPPKGVDPKIWAAQNAKRMRTFQIDASAVWSEM